MHNMFTELDVVALTHSIEKYGLSEGRRGTIVQLYKNGEAFEAEFVDNEGYLIALITLTPKDVRLVWSKHLYKDVPYSDRSTTSITKDEELKWKSLKYLKPDKTNDFTYNFRFI